MPQRSSEENDELHSSFSKLPDRELYAIPRSSGWFAWDAISEVERRELPEFFDGRSISRNPRAYKEYRDFIINKYREDQARRLTFSEVRKSLVADVGSLRKVFISLDRWGLINFSAVDTAEAAPAPDAGDGCGKVGPVVVNEEGAPAGVQVVPSSLVGVPAAAASGRGGGGFRLPPLASYTVVFSDCPPGKLSRACGADCESLESGKQGDLAWTPKEEKVAEVSIGEPEKNDSIDGKKEHDPCSWTEAETLLLLEAVLKHGDDWDLISQHVRTKSKAECIGRLIQLPFGESMLDPVGSKGENKDSTNQTIKVDTVGQPLVEQSRDTIANGQDGTCTDESNPEVVSVHERPSKRSRIEFSMDHATYSLMQQVTHLSGVAGRHVASVAADAAMLALCEESTYASGVFLSDFDEAANKSEADTLNMEIETENLTSEGLQEKDMPDSDPGKDFVAMAFRIRATIAAAFGVTAARAKLLADVEEREIEQLVDTIIDMQVKRIQCKMRDLEQLEFIMEKEYDLVQQMKRSVVEDWLGVLHQAFQSGIPRWKDRAIPWLFMNGVS